MKFKLLLEGMGIDIKDVCPMAAQRELFACPLAKLYSTMPRALG